MSPLFYTQTPLEQGAIRVCRALHERGFIAYLAGGCVRDLILHRSPKDYDIATNALPEAVSEIFPRSITLWKHFGVVRVLFPEGEYEVTTFRSDGPYLNGRHPSSVTFSTPEMDAKRRDFTINALFLDPLSDTIIDYVEGQLDIQRQIIRAVGNPPERFAEDYLRLLRAVRFSARFRFTIEPVTLDAIKSLYSGIRNVSAERIRDEIVKMLTEGNPRWAFELLYTTQLLHEILPEVAELKGVGQPTTFHPEGDALEHTLRAIQYLENSPVTLAMAVLLHDVGKKPTITNQSQPRFPKHEAVGAEMARQVMERLRFSRQEIEAVAWLVKQHMTLLQYPAMRESTRKRLFSHPLFPQLLELVRIDLKASCGDTSAVETIQEDYQKFLSESEKKPFLPLLRGKDLIQLGYTPGPLFRQILTEVENAQMEGMIRTREEAIQFVVQKWPIG